MTTNSIGMKLRLIPPGEFQMGSPCTEEGRKDDEDQHRVRITRPFYLGAYEVTQGEFQALIGWNPSWFSLAGRGSEKVAGLDTSLFPVDRATWFDAVEFCNKLSEKESFAPYYRLTNIERNEYENGTISEADIAIIGGSGYRIPTEAEWEYACRAGTTTPFHFGSQSNGDEANVDGTKPYGTTTKGSFLERTTTVGSHQSNAFGLFDMHGNVWEWCWDAYERGFYSTSPENDPTGPSHPFFRLPDGGWWPAMRVLRGGSWRNAPTSTRSANRYCFPPSADNNLNGFRVARTP